METMILDLRKDDEKMILDISKADPSFNEAECIMSWKQGRENTSGHKLDLDIYAFMLNAQGKVDSVKKVVYHKNKVGLNESIILPEDSRDGERDESLFITANKLPSDVRAVAIYALLHNAAKYKHDFGMLSEATFSIKNRETDFVVGKYRISDYPNQFCLHIGNFVIAEDGGLSFIPVGVAGCFDGNDIFQLYV